MEKIKIKVSIHADKNKLEVNDREKRSKRKKKRKEKIVRAPYIISINQNSLVPQFFFFIRYIITKPVVNGTLNRLYLWINDGRPVRIVLYRIDLLRFAVLLIEICLRYSSTTACHHQFSQ